MGIHEIGYFECLKVTFVRSLDTRESKLICISIGYFLNFRVDRREQTSIQAKKQDEVDVRFHSIGRWFSGWFFVSIGLTESSDQSEMVKAAPQKPVKPVRQNPTTVSLSTDDDDGGKESAQSSAIPTNRSVNDLTASSVLVNKDHHDAAHQSSVWKYATTISLEKARCNISHVGKSSIRMIFRTQIRLHNFNMFRKMPHCTSSFLLSCPRGSHMQTS